MNEDIRDDLRSTSEELIADSQQLTQLERGKLDPDASAAELEQISAKAVELTREMAEKAEIQQRIASGANRPN